MANFMAAFLLSIGAGGGVAVIASVAAVQAVQSSSANTGADAPPDDVATVDYADE